MRGDVGRDRVLGDEHLPRVQVRRALEILIKEGLVTSTKGTGDVCSAAQRAGQLAEAISSFGLDALAGAVPLNVDLEVMLSVLAHTVCTALRRLPGYHAATPDALQRRFVNTAWIIHNHGSQIVIQLNRRTYSAVLRQASLPETITVPWWEGRTLLYQYA
jgi:hypothetical protein